MWTRCWHTSTYYELNKLTTAPCHPLKMKLWSLLQYHVISKPKPNPVNQLQLQWNLFYSKHMLTKSWHETCKSARHDLYKCQICINVRYIARLQCCVWCDIGLLVILLHSLFIVILDWTPQRNLQLLNAFHFMTNSNDVTKLWINKSLNDHIYTTYND